MAHVDSRGSTNADKNLTKSPTVDSLIFSTVRGVEQNVSVEPVIVPHLSTPPTTRNKAEQVRKKIRPEKANRYKKSRTIDRIFLLSDISAPNIAFIPACHMRPASVRATLCRVGNL